MDKILISSSSFAVLDSQPLDILKVGGFEIISNTYARRLEAGEIVSLGKDCVGILAGLEIINAEVLSQLTRLKVISRIGTGLDNIDLEAADRLNIAVCNTPDSPVEAVAELAVSLVFNLLRKISPMDRLMRRGIWQRISGNLIQGKSIGIIGLGRIGKRVAEQLSGFAVCIMAADPHKDESWLKGRNIAMVGLEELLGKSDIIILCASGSSCIIKEREFFLMKRGMYLINVSRGAAVEEAALYGAIKEGRLAGAALDVFAKEPYNGPLLELENVILTPHIGSYTEESRAAMEIEAVHNLLNALKNIKGAGNEERRRA